MRAVAITIICLLVGVLLIIVFFYPLFDGDSNEWGLYVDEVTMTYSPSWWGGHNVQAFIGIRNGGGTSQELDGYELKTGLFVEGVLMDTKSVPLEGTLGASSYTSYEVELHSDRTIFEGNEIRLSITINDSSGNMVDSDDRYFTA